ncbi:hypothetical protein GE115_05350 [Agromyces sp. CFH 90414]|uniref:Potassium transporter Trk n=1 Tax=Agromyces agglutinans TaxID=2662258 RepID=A0A6I2FDX6_9MICO|nr:hypothetical protein [Agromyces agglutinans]MRG59298.1 hypothetical protein [Agromyces agglutinans]
MSDTPREPEHDRDAVVGPDAEDAAAGGDAALVPADDGSAPVVVPMVVTSEVDDEAVTVRRAPRYGRFIVAGFVLGAILALVLTFAFPENEEFDRGQVFGFLLLGLGTVGVAFGAIVALVFDKVLSGRAGTAIAEHEHEHARDGD